MASLKDQAIALRRLDYSETSQVLLFLTRDHGTQRLIAKGIRRGTKKGFATGIDLLERGQVVFIRKLGGEGRLGTLIEWRQTSAYLGLRENLQRLYTAEYAVEVTAAMVEDGDPHPELFNALAECLEALSSSDHPAVLLVEYQCALLTSVGLWPDLSRCVACDRPAPPGRGAYFSAHQGGLICRDCEGGLPEKRKVTAATLTALRQREWTNETVRLAFELLNYTISHVIGRAPLLAKFVGRQ